MPADGSEGSLTTSKYAQLAKCSEDTAALGCDTFWNSDEKANALAVLEGRTTRHAAP